MNTIEKIKKTQSLNNQDKKESIIEEIGDLYEYGELDKDEIIEGVNLLLAQVVLEKDSEFKETIFHTIHNAVVFNEVAADISLDILLPNCSGLSNENLSYVLSFLGFSGNEKYLATLRTYRNSPNKEIQTTANEAINEIRYRASK